MLTWGNTGKKTPKICKGDIRGSEHCNTAKKRQMPQYFNTKLKLKLYLSKTTSLYVKFGAKNNLEFVNEHFN